MAQEEDEYRAAKGVGGRSLSKVAETKEQRKARRERMLEVRGGGDDGMDAAAGKMTGRWVYEYRNEPVYKMGAYGIMEGRSHAVGQLCYEPYPSTIADLRKILEVCVHVLHSGWPCLRCDLTVLCGVVFA